jgi:hypothetical protein
MALMDGGWNGDVKGLLLDVLSSAPLVENKNGQKRSGKQQSGNYMRNL